MIHATTFFYDFEQNFICTLAPQYFCTMPKTNSTFLLSLLIVSVQFILITLIVLQTSFSQINVMGAILSCIAVFILLWSVWVMKKSRLRIMPQPSAQATLITSGPYSMIRHPMYTAVLTGCAGLITINFSTTRLLLFIVLTLVLVVKLNLEEKLLLLQFKQYQQYRLRTYKLIPFIF